MSSPGSRLFFSQLAVVTFGGAYAVLAYVAQAAVETYGWLSPAEMLDGLGMAETTPGPLIQVVQFVGFLAAFRDAGRAEPVRRGGARHRCSTTWVTFAPSFLWILLGAPFSRAAARRNARSAARCAAITAAVVGVILNLALWFAPHVIFSRQVAWCGLGLRRSTFRCSASFDPWALLAARRRAGRGLPAPARALRW